MPAHRQREQEWATSLAVISRQIWWTQGFPQGWKNKSKCTYSMCWHSWKTGSTCGCWAWNSLQTSCPPWLEVRDLKGAERGNIQTYEERFTFLPGTSGTSWSLQKDGMFSMTESISWLSPETSERCVRWLNPVQSLLEGGKAAVLENNPDTHLWFVKQKTLKGFSLTTFIAFLVFFWSWSFPTDLISFWLFHDESHNPTSLSVYQMQSRPD